MMVDMDGDAVPTVEELMVEYETDRENAEYIHRLFTVGVVPDVIDMGDDDEEDPAEE